MSRIYNKDDLVANHGYNLQNVEADEEKLNVLHQFRTYSYHHILIVANTTQAAKYAMGSNDVDAWMHESYEKKFRAQKPPGVPDGKDAYVVLINGLIDSEFAIQSLEIETIVDPNARSSNPHASFVEGTMEIMEPKGIRFMNLLKHACDVLDSDPNGLTFVLKTVFVGYTDGLQGEPKIHQVLETRAFQFLMMDLTGEFTAAGSSYQIQFVGHINGTPRLPIFSKLEQANVKGGTVKEALSSLQKLLNDAATKSYIALTAQLDESKNENKDTSIDPAKYSPKGRKIVYSIQVADVYANMPLDNVNLRNQSAGAQAQMATPQGIDIETAITDILLSSTKITELMNQNIKEGYKTVFKIDSVLETTIEEAIVNISIKACKVPVTVKDNRENKGDIIPPAITNRYIIEFDYIFTGANVEVLEYDMKMAMGMAFFQMFGSSNNVPGDFHAASGDITSLGSGMGTVMNSKSTTMRGLTIVPASGVIQDPASRNKREPAKTADFRTFMARQAAFEAINSKLRIVGIPWLYEAFSPHAEDIASPEKVSLKEQIPLIKVNVRVPSRDSEFADGLVDSYTEQFWYTGYFQIMSIKSVFRDGKFDQELDLISTLFEELVTPTGAGTAPAKRSDTPTASTPNATPAVNVKKADKSAKPAPVITAEQKAKMGVKSTPLTPEELLNCQTVRKQPITMATARRTFLSKTVTLEHLIRRPVNIPHLTDRIMNNLCALAKKVEEIQALLGHSITITSAFRCAAYNAGTKGSSKTSDHMQGVAIDFVCPAFGSPKKIYAALASSGLDIRQVICETSSSTSWVHISFNIDSTISPIPPGRKFIPDMRV